MLAHELMQPLTAVINYVEACRRTLDNCEGQIPERALNCMDKAVQEASRAGQLVHRLRRLVEKGETDKEAVSINDTIKEATAAILEQARGETVSVRLNLAPALPAVLIDRIQIQQVIANLLRNGVEALVDQPERVLTIGSAQPSDGVVEVTVADTGSGLCPQIAARLFQPVVSRKAQGMGLGLSICRTIIDAHGGKIWATRGPTGGTIFHFTLATAR
jgi:two-component system sensor kinase FixL